MGEWGSFLVSQVRLRAFISARIGRVGVLLRPPLRILHAELPAVFKRFLGREMKNGSFVLILLRLLLCWTFQVAAGTLVLPELKREPESLLCSSAWYHCTT